MKIFFKVISIVLLFQCACKKTGFNDLAGTEKINGVALLHDSYSSSNAFIRLKGITVYLRSAANPNAYLYTVRTDNLGQFSFTGIDKTASYLIDASYDSAQVRYTGKRNYDTPNTFTSLRDTLLLDVDPQFQNGIHLVVKDYLGGTVPNGTVWVFNSAALFVADTSSGAAFAMQPDIYGIANKYSVATGNYFFRVKTRSGNVELVDEQKAIIDNFGIKQVTMTVRPVPLQGFGNGIDVKVVDQSGAAVSNAMVYFYKNYETYIQDSSKFQSSLFKLTSAVDGHAAAYVINPATYFIWARKVVNINDTLKSRDHYSVAVSNLIAPGDVTVK